MGERRAFDVAVVGLGGIGSGAAYWAVLLNDEPSASAKKLVLSLIL